jgi:hypothetical protein
MGIYAMGQGQYNLNTAQARSINADTAMRWNQYWFQSQLQANRRERALLARRQARDSGTSAANEARIRDHPTTADIQNGDALNAALDQVTDPRVQDSALRLATTKIAGRSIRDIPFFVPTETVTLTLDQLTAESGWPFVLRDPKFAANRTLVTGAVDKALAEDIEGDLSPQTVKDVRDALTHLKNAFEASPPAVENVRLGEAREYLKNLLGIARMLERPDIDKVLAELDTIQETTLGSLLVFMHTFNLRFGKPGTPAQRAVYQALYPPLDALRDRVIASVDPRNPSTHSARVLAPPTEVLGALTFEQLEGPHRTVEPRSRTPDSGCGPLGLCVIRPWRHGRVGAPPH